MHYIIGFTPAHMWRLTAWYDPQRGRRAPVREMHARDRCAIKLARAEGQLIALNGVWVRSYAWRICMRAYVPQRYLSNLAVRVFYITRKR